VGREQEALLQSKVQEKQRQTKNAAGNTQSKYENFTTTKRELI